MTHEDMVDVVRDVADAVDGEVRKDYSGRCMYGKTCYGVVAASASRILEEAGERGLKGGKMDSMGLQAIVYWPHVKGEAREVSHEG